jgi:hypothetical protein
LEDVSPLNAVWWPKSLQRCDERSKLIMERAFSPFFPVAIISWGFAPGFYGVTLSILIPASVIGRWNSTIAF